MKQNTGAASQPGDLGKGRLIYECPFDSPQSVADWRLEGSAEMAFEDGWMKLWSPGQANEHVSWAPPILPDRFAAEWEFQNLNPQAGLCIVFFAAAGLNGQDIFDPSLAKRDATFPQYHSGDIRCYHISYLANSPTKDPNRDTSNLNRNPGKHLVATGPIAIRGYDTDVHVMRLTKDGPHIQLAVDGRTVIDWIDDGQFGPPLGAGRLGLRQMRWTVARYRNLRVWQLR